MKVNIVNRSNGDLLVANAARASFDRSHTEFDPESDARLLRYLAREGHISPFFHPTFSIRVTAPIFVARQLMRSTVGLAVSEVSRRYVSGPPTYWMPDKWREAVKDKKQGSGSAMPRWKQRIADAIYRLSLAIADTAYSAMLKLSVCPEQARAVLPLAMETTWVWTGSLYAFFRVWQLRSAPGAQAESREIATMIERHCFTECPYAWDALRAAAER